MNLATIFCPNLDCLARGQTGRGNVQVHSHKEKRCYCLELQIERLNATFRQRLPWLTRRCRYLARQPETLQASMFVLGCVYNFCTYHHSLRIALHLSHRRRRWLHRTPAIAAGLTDHRWSIAELFEFRVPPPRWSPPKRRGRHSKHTLQLINH
ncbi:MAG: hypothetical protein KDI62_00940 [Anaerolineae bacterium]|nr:hypothetical protein [Anaerolineae bacterium]